MSNIAVVLAAGSGQRFGGDSPKQLLKLAGKPVLVHTVEVFEKHADIDRIIIVTRTDLIGEIRRIVTDAGLTKVDAIIEGGATRSHSTKRPRE